jgi:hypothetical protein
MKKLLILAAVLTLSACGNMDPNNSAGLQYQISEDGCDTGEHGFATLSEYCEALKNEELNHHCAHDARTYQFNLSCVSHRVSD